MRPAGGVGEPVSPMRVAEDETGPLPAERGYDRDRPGESDLGRIAREEGVGEGAEGARKGSEKGGEVALERGEGGRLRGGGSGLRREAGTEGPDDAEARSPYILHAYGRGPVSDAADGVNRDVYPTDGDEEGVGRPSRPGEVLDRHNTAVGGEERAQNA